LSKLPLIAAVAFTVLPASTITRPLMFDTPEADRVLAQTQVFPKDSAWHEDIRQRPRHPNSAAIIHSIGADLPLG
jgi:hypothetical protein